MKCNENLLSISVDETRLPYYGFMQTPLNTEMLYDMKAVSFLLRLPASQSTARLLTVQTYMSLYVGRVSVSCIGRHVYV
jgi:hypothetical protein